MKKYNLPFNILWLNIILAHLSCDTLQTPLNNCTKNEVQQNEVQQCEEGLYTNNFEPDGEAPHEIENGNKPTRGSCIGMLESRPEKRSNSIATNHLDQMLAFVAAKLGNLEIFEALVDMGAELNMTDEHGQTPVYLAAQNGQTTVLEMLAENSADLNTPNKKGWTPIHVAAYYNRADVIEVLVDNGVDLNTPNEEGKTPILLAAKYSRKKAFTKLRALGADLNTSDNEGWTLVHEATYKDNLDMLRMLATAEINLNQPD